MSKISISVYKITINKKRVTDELEVLNDFNSGQDLLDLLTMLPAQFLKANSNKKVLDEAETKRRTIISDNNLDTTGRIVSGYIESGEYGFESVIVDEEGKKVHDVLKEHSLMRPFFFLISLPKDKRVGYLLIQRFENYGVYTILSKMLKSTFASKYSDYTLSLKPDGLESSEALHFLNEGKISKASFAIFDSESIANIFTNNNTNDQFNYEDIKAEIVISAKRNRFVAMMNSVKGMLNSGKDLKVKLTDKDIPYERLKIYVKVGKEEKVLDLSKWDTFSRDIDVTHRLEYDKTTGLPLSSSIKEECHKIIDQLDKKND
ncbi:hypothetical protein OHD16_06025 [Sphingobacterium sp. ML3W]|uniref:hypothetical protein n=1 Tax=Sphingobacterium sp. ML3W TaxID=1538644 RepID=UPI00249C258F|nr:hypothetical protein [Sphingobacterium sp. ML3W]WFA79524.1 hypothetical protein OGI71_26265 [Sphingobacterium sp. ML3W]